MSRNNRILYSQIWINVKKEKKLTLDLRHWIELEVSNQTAGGGDGSRQ